jgi:hypothetical protein
MKEVITFKSLKFMVNTDIKPENYKVLVLNYLKHKEHLIEVLRDKRDTSDLELQFVKAIRLARRLGIVWIPK